MLDQISRALPPMLWLTELKQDGTDVIIDGKCTTLTGLSEFVSNLEASGYFKRSVEIVSTTTERAAPPARADQVHDQGAFPAARRSPAPAAGDEDGLATRWWRTLKVVRHRPQYARIVNSRWN
jgi:Tfp pilus assembly protein PilN